MTTNASPAAQTDVTLRGAAAALASDVIARNAIYSSKSRAVARNTAINKCVLKIVKSRQTAITGSWSNVLFALTLPSVHVTVSTSVYGTRRKAVTSVTTGTRFRPVCLWETAITGGTFNVSCTNALSCVDITWDCVVDVTAAHLATINVRCRQIVEAIGTNVTLAASDVWFTEALSTILSDQT